MSEETRDWILRKGIENRWWEAEDEKSPDSGIPENLSLILDILSPQKLIKASARVDGKEILGSVEVLFLRGTLLRVLQLDLSIRR